MSKKMRKRSLPTLFMGILSVFWIAPILVVILNSFKKKAYIFKNPFGISSKTLADGFDKWKNGELYYCQEDGKFYDDAGRSKLIKEHIKNKRLNNFLKIVLLKYLIINL